MKKVLVTGGAGFIGSHLCERLVAAGNKVTCLDNFLTGREENIRELSQHDRFELVRQTVTDPLQMEVDEIHNLACPASPVHYQRDPIATIKTNFLGTLNLLELARSAGASILQASTSEIYGDPAVSPQPETYWGNVNPVGPRSCYDEGKRAAETLVVDFHRTHGVDAKIVRIFNTYGPRMAPDDGRVVSNFIVQALRGDRITIYGDGSQTRAFCYVDDLVDGILAMMAAADWVGPVNLGNPGEIRIIEFAELIKELTGSRSEIEFLPALEDDPAQRNPDISLAKARLGWEPTVSLEEGLRRTIAFFDSTLSEGERG